MNEVTTPQKKSKLQQIRDFIKPPDPLKHVEDAYGILKEVAGFQPIFNIRDLEQRRTEIRDILKDIENKTWNYDLKKGVVEKTFRLFFQTGSPWYRGLSNRELAEKVRDFIEQYQTLRGLPSFMGDLFSEAIQLLNLSWQEVDVTNTPAYVAQSTPIISPYGQRINLGGGSGGESGTRDETA